MADPAFRAEQHAGLNEPHIAPITAYINALRSGSRWLPYVAPLHGGIHARLLSIARDPGPKTQEQGGSGMLCVENDDQTAANQLALLEQGGLTAADYNPWNAYPWYINAAPNREQIAEGTAALTGLIELMPKLEVVVLQGRHAQDAWRAALDTQPELRRRRLVSIDTFHPSNQALQTNVPGERERRIEHRRAAWRDAGALLRGAERLAPES